MSGSFIRALVNSFKQSNKLTKAVVVTGTIGGIAGGTWGYNQEFPNRENDPEFQVMKPYLRPYSIVAGAGSGAAISIFFLTTLPLQSIYLPWISYKLAAIEEENKGIKQ
jgi:hypothetical protein